MRIIIIIVIVIAMAVAIAIAISTAIVIIMSESGTNGRKGYSQQPTNRPFDQVTSKEVYEHTWSTNLIRPTGDVKVSGAGWQLLPVQQSPNLRSESHFNHST